MNKNILTKQQKEILEFIAKSNLKDSVYFTEGTALSTCYFQHRLSTDIDLFSLDLIDNLSLQIFIKNLKNTLKIKKVKHSLKLNRNLYNLDGLKFEIVYFPFPFLAKQETFFKIKTDSLKDLSTNKLLALYQRNDPKDIFDLYFILKKGKFHIDELISNIEKKFGEKIKKEYLLAKIQQNLPLLDILQPLAFDKKIIPKVKNYFQKNNKKYLLNILL